MLFRQIVFYSLLVGALSGLLLTAVQFWQVIPIIQNAERYEGETTSAPVHATHEHAAHEHPTGAWAPADGIERMLYTLFSNVLSGIGFSLMLIVAIVFSRKSKSEIKLDWRHGLLWGIAGYSIFYLSPSLGVPPEIPGVIAAPLEDRQLWWLVAVLCTAAGLAGVSFGKSPWRWAALSLLVVPYLIGAPESPSYIPSNQLPAVTIKLAELGQKFIGATAIANGIFWLALGLASVWITRRFISPYK